VAEQESGFEIRGRFYPWPTSFRLGDAVLIEKVTGLDWPAFTDRLPEEDESPDTTEPDDLVVVIGLMAASIWQHHEQWRRDKVVRYVEGLDLETITFIGGDEDEPAESDASPPDLKAVGENISETSPSPSTPLPDASSAAPSPSSSGVQDSTTTSPDSPPAE
jgi:hypothetical protein